MPSTSTDRIDGLTTSVAVKAPVRVASTANLTLAGQQTVNGVSVIEGDRVLAKDQTTPSENGIYVVSTGNWTRALDFDGNRDVVQGTLVVVNENTSFYYRVTAANPITIGTTAITFEVVSGAITQSSIGLALYPRTSAEIAASVTPVNYFYPPLTLARYGGDPTGVSNSNSAFTALAAVIAATTSGCQATIGPGTYLLTSQIAFTAQQFFRCAIFGYGATIKTTGAISAFKISGGTTTGGISVYGLKIDHRANANATYGYEVVGTSRSRFYECTVEPGGNAAGYAAFVFRNSTPSDSNTGSFWGLVQDCTIRRESGADGAVPPIGVLLQGNPNATIIRGGAMEGASVIRIQCESGQTFIGNGILIDGVAFESFTTAIDGVAGDATHPIGGLRITNCRAESGTTFLSLTVATTQPPFPTFLAGNYAISSVTTYINNPNNLYIETLDNTSDVASMFPTWDTRGVFAIRNRSGSGHALDLTPGNDTNGILLRNAAGTSVLKAAASGSGTRVQVGASNAAELELFDVAGISSSGTVAKNLCGSATFAAATTVAVSFPVNEPDANYRITLTAKADPVGRLWTSGEAVGGFTINNSSSTSITVNWHLLR